MKNLYKVLLSITITTSLCLPSFADIDPYNFVDKEMTPLEISIWKYKMEKISVKNEINKWEIVQGINTKLTDMQMLRLVGAENVAAERLKNIEFKQNLGNTLSLVGLAGAILAGLLLGNVIKVNNGFYYGLGGLGVSGAVVVAGNAVSPIVSDEDAHILTMEEAIFTANSYNKKLKEVLKIPETVQ